MIRYSNGGLYHLINLCHLRGSAFPFAFYVALPCALISLALKILMSKGLMQWMEWETDHLILLDSAPWNGFSFLVGFLIVFRTSQSYNRFWDACRHTADMRAQWYDAAAALCAFCAHSQASEEAILHFKHTMVRLFSMLHALALGEMEDTDGSQIVAFNVELLDPDGIDADSLRYLHEAECKVGLILQWMLVLIVKNIRTGVLSIPPPILSRVFQQVGNGMVALHQAIKISTVPFPFPYAQACDFLLVMHWLTTPVIIQTWTSGWAWSFIFSFIMVFIFWTLNTTAIGLENPFGLDENDLDYGELQHEMNRQLLVLLRPGSYRVPDLAPEFRTKFTWGRTRATAHRKSTSSNSGAMGRCLREVWDDIRQRGVLGEQEAYVQPSRTMCSGTATSVSQSFRGLTTEGAQGGEGPEAEAAVAEDPKRLTAAVEDDIVVNHKHLTAAVEEVLSRQAGAR